MVSLPPLDIFQKILSQIGITTRQIGRLKLGHGLSGNMTTVAVITIIAGAALGAAATNFWPIQAGCLIVIAAMGFYAIIRIERIGRERPDVALLEGAELLLWQQQQLQLRTKRQPRPRQETVQAYQAPEVAPSTEEIEHVEGEDKGIEQS